MSQNDLWSRFKSRLFVDPSSGFALDTSRLNYDDQFLSELSGSIDSAIKSMSALEKGAVANPDENRMVGHYWLRNSTLAPSPEIRDAIDNTVKNIKTFAADIHSGKIKSSQGKFAHLLVVGIGGSALGPQFVNQALSSAADPMDIYFFDNTDPDGMIKTVQSIPSLASTLVVVISKSGGTKETRNGQLIAKQALQSAGLDFSKHFVAVTGEGSELDNTAKKENWLARFPMWDWVGGRTSEFSAVGLLPMALQGFDIDAVLKGAAHMDELTRAADFKKNPAALMALGWYHCGNGRGQKDMVVLPYKDRLELFSRYLQQLVMESLGKEHDLAGKVVNQGIAVYGNKGSTDQHAYVQQLRDGLNNFFAVFIEVNRDLTQRKSGGALSGDYQPIAHEVEPGVTSGDYLQGFYLGTRRALYEKGRESITVTLSEVSEFTIGMLVALFERAVGLYASLVNVNAYHQPGVEAGKKAAAEVLKIQAAVVSYLKDSKEASSVDEIAAGAKADPETVFKVLRHLAANDRLKLSKGATIFEDRYSV